jgi:hypothetical protein
MSIFSWLRSRTSTRSRWWDGFRIRPTAPRFRPRLEALEDRCLPSTFCAATATDLIADIKAANLQGGANTIVLTAPTTSPYVLTATDNTTDGNTVLPAIGGNLTILTNNGSASPGFGDTIDAGKHGRLFDVASGATLTLENITLQNGSVRGTPGGTSKGGAIYNQGTLVLSQVLVHNNTADFTGAGGGIWSNGALTVKNSTFEGNVAENEFGGPAFGGAIYIAGGTASITDSAFGDPNGGGGNTAKGQTAYGGAMYVAAGTATLSGDSFGLVTYGFYGFSYSGNSAQGGILSPGDGYGGALYVARGSVTLTNDYIQGNCVENLGNPDGAAYGDHGGYGGGIYIADVATVYIDSFTLNNTTANLSNGGDIWGPYHLLP